MITKPAIAVERSANTKTGEVSATYVAQTSCPAACPLQGSGCYAETGRAGIATRQLARASVGETPETLARSEANAIDALSGKRPLRLHVVGDASTNAAAATIAQAAERYTERGGQPVWTYTHAWRTVDRGAWGNVAVRASVEHAKDIPLAHARGYSAALVVEAHPASGRAWTTSAGEKIVPCPEQTRGATCTSCRLCMTEGVTVAFAAHSANAGAVIKAIGG